MATLDGEKKESSLESVGRIEELSALPPHTHTETNTNDTNNNEHAVIHTAHHPAGAFSIDQR